LTKFTAVWLYLHKTDILKLCIKISKDKINEQHQQILFENFVKYYSAQLFKSTQTPKLYIYT